MAINAGRRKNIKPKHLKGLSFFVALCIDMIPPFCVWRSARRGAFLRGALIVLLLFIYLFVCLSVCSFVRSFVCLFVCLFDCLFVCLCVCVFLCLIDWLIVWLFVWLFVCLIDWFIVWLFVSSWFNCAQLRWSGARGVVIRATRHWWENAPAFVLFLLLGSHTAFCWGAVRQDTKRFVALFRLRFICSHNTR